MIDKKDIARAAGLLRRYKDAKASLERRVVEDELWYRMRHWDVMRNTAKARALRGPEPTSAWLFNTILNKHADAMDNFPTPVVLPRERSDEQSARVISEVLPVVFEYNNFGDVYAQQWWKKLRDGTAVYGVFWDPTKHNGLGDVEIRGVDLLKVFWEPGITDIQQSSDLFIVDLADTEALEAMWPEHAGRLGGRAIELKQYVFDDAVDTSGKSLVVDWYYKLRLASGRTVLHYAKFVGDTLLYASENDPRCAEEGWYSDGSYPLVFDNLFPEEGTPVGFGYVAICKDPQMYIDKLSANILEHTMMESKPRFWVSESTAVNEQEFLDWSKPLVHVAGELDERRIQEIRISPLPGVVVGVLQQKIQEMKETAANRDVSSGGASGGVTAAAAIAALQEAGNKASRDMIGASYRAYTRIAELVLARMAQFYDAARTFRITGQGPGDYRFVDLSGAPLRAQQLLGPDGLPALGADGAPLMRRPVFDLKIRAEKRSPFSRMEQNERAKELYSMGFFRPERAAEALGALEMMDFEGIDAVREYIADHASVGGGVAPEVVGAGELPDVPPAAGGRSPLVAHPPMEDYVARLARRTL